MRNLLAGLAALVILFGVLGWVRTWYQVGTLPAEPGRFAFRVEFDPAKVGSDVTEAVRYVHSHLSKPGEEKTPEETK